MFLLDRLFGRRKATVTAPAEPAELPPPEARLEPSHAAPGTAIGYRPELIDQLEQDHRELLRIFSALKIAAEAGNLAEAAEKLDVFRHALQGHLLKENVKLYVYLEHALAGDATSHELMRDFRHEMDRIGKAVVAFLDRYRTLAAEPARAADFRRDLDDMGRVLVDRMRNEEGNLYPLYGPV